VVLFFITMSISPNLLHWLCVCVTSAVRRGQRCVVVALGISSHVR